MKEGYFQPDTIDPLSRYWLDLYGSPRKESLQPFKIQKAALLILDMQEYFLEPDSHAYVPSGRIILPRLQKIIRTFRDAGQPIFATRHANDEVNAGRMAAWWSELLTKDHPLGSLHPDLSFEEGEIILKTQYDAFYQSDLGRFLSREGVEQLVIGGVLTHLCCETTARSAFIRGFEVFFLVDGTATYTEAFQTASLRNLAHGFAVLTTTDQLIKKGS